MEVNLSPAEREFPQPEGTGISGSPLGNAGRLRLRGVCSLGLRGPRKYQSPRWRQMTTGGSHPSSLKEMFVTDQSSSAEPGPWLVLRKHSEPPETTGEVERGTPLGLAATPCGSSGVL